MERQGLSVLPGFIAIAGQDEPEIEIRNLDPLGKSAKNGWSFIILSWMILQLLPLTLVTPVES